jgi:transposase
MKTLSLDLRERIVAAYDRQEGTREEIARRFNVSLGMVKKLLQQRRRTGDIAPRHHFAGRKAWLLPQFGEKLRRLVKAKPDLTLEQLRAALGLKCTLPAIHYVLAQLGLTFKKNAARRRARAARHRPGTAAVGARAGRTGSRAAGFP